MGKIERLIASVMILLQKEVVSANEFATLFQVSKRTGANSGYQEVEMTLRKIESMVNAVNRLVSFDYIKMRPSAMTPKCKFQRDTDGQLYNISGALKGP